MIDSLGGDSVRVPSGKKLSELTSLKQISLGDYSYLIGRYMFSHAQDGRFYGSVGTASEGIWPGQHNDSLRKSTPRILRRNGFKPDQLPSGVFTWIIPSMFLEWSAGHSDDDGSRTTGGPVARSVFTLQMSQLLQAIHNDPARHPRDYQKMLPNVSVSAVADSLERYGFIERKGNTIAVRYYPTDKPVPKYKGKLTVPKAKPVVRTITKVEAPKQPEPPTNMVDDLEMATGGTVVYDKAGRMLVLKDGHLHEPKMEWTLKRID